MEIQKPAYLVEGEVSRDLLGGLFGVRIGPATSSERSANRGYRDCADAYQATSVTVWPFAVAL